MDWRWRDSLNLGGGARATLTAQGVGVSWGFAGFRVGRSPTGSFWVSISIPGTGISFFRYLSRGSGFPSLPQLTVPQAQHNLPPTPNASLTANQRVLDEIRRSKP
jgi:hypothetical protein